MEQAARFCSPHMPPRLATSLANAEANLPDLGLGGPKQIGLQLQGLVDSDADVLEEEKFVISLP